VQQDLLQHYSDPALRVYAVWFNMYPGDARSKWPDSLLIDPRVLHYWDEDRISGKQYLTHLPAMLDRRAPETMTPSADAMWDAYYVYPRGEHWRGPVPLPASWGYPIMVTREQLVEQADALLKK
jgi:hypothetical protein